MNAYREALEKSQWERLSRLLDRLSSSNAFYRSKIDEAGPIGSLQEFPEAFPLTTKDEIRENQEAHPPYGTNLTFPLEKYTRFCQTSGTSGAPIPWLDTEESWNAMLDCWTRVFDEATVPKSSAVMFAFSFGPFLGFWTAFEAAVRRGNLCLPGGGLRSAARLELMKRYQAKVLCCTPTYALHLGELSKGELGLDVLIVAGEPGGSLPAMRDRISRLWGGARIFDHHGMTEVGPVTYEHVGKPSGLAVIEDSFFAEVLDPATGKASEEGELVLTTLHRDASPLLRYRTGDFVRRAFSEKGELILDGGILGRIDDMVVVRGVNIYPGALDNIVREFPEISEYEVRLSQGDSLVELEVKIEEQELAGALEDRLRDVFSLRIPVSVVASGSLPRYEFKANRWIKDIK